MRIEAAYKPPASRIFRPVENPRVARCPASIEILAFTGRRLDDGGNDNEGRSIRELFGDLGY
jgi:hypothetical protein